MPYDSAHQNGTLVETIMDGLELTLEWMDMTTQAPFKMCVTGSLRGSDLPADAIISFPKSLLVVWNSFVVGHADMKATYGVVPEDSKHVDNVLLTPTSDHVVMSKFIRALLKEKSISIELQADEVGIHAGNEDYPNTGASFRKSITIKGFDDMKDQITLGNIKFIGCAQSGNAVSTDIDIEIKNPSNVSVLVDDLPVDLYYKGVKIADLIVPGPFMLHHSSSGTVFKEKVLSLFRPKNPRDAQCKDFVADYITTPENLEISLRLEKTTIKLASSTVSIPRFRLTCTVCGINKQFVTGATAYVSLIRAPLTKKFDFTFDFDNPVDTPVTITFIKGEAKIKKLLLCKFQERMEMTVPVNATSTSQKIQKATICLSLRQLLTFIGKTELKIDVDVQRANVSIGTFNLPNLAFNNLTDIRTRIKWSL